MTLGGYFTKGNKADDFDVERICELLERFHAGISLGYENENTRIDGRLYEGLVDDTTRVMLRIRAVYRGRAIGSSSRSVYHPAKRAYWLDQISEGGARFRAEALYAQLDSLVALRQRAKRAMPIEARRHKAYERYEPCRQSVECERPRSWPSSATHFGSGRSAHLWLDAALAVTRTRGAGVPPEPRCLGFDDRPPSRSPRSAACTAFEPSDDRNTGPPVARFACTRSGP